MNKGRYIQMNLPLINVVDSVDNIFYLDDPNYPPLLDAWECKLEILMLDYDRFDFCTRPDDFAVTLNGMAAAVSYSGALPQRLITWQATNVTAHYQMRVKTVYPDPITSINKPHLVVDILALPYSVVDPITPGGTPIQRGLISNVMTVRFQDVIADNLELLNFTLDIDVPMNKALVTNSNTNFLSPSALDGDFFTVTI